MIELAPLEAVERPEKLASGKHSIPYSKFFLNEKEMESQEQTSTAEDSNSSSPKKNEAFLCTEKDVRRCFTVADKDKSGTLCKEEILQVLQAAAYPIPDDFDKIMMIVDRNKDGRIDYSEFAKIYSNNMR